jgi:hypothetical protein
MWISSYLKKDVYTRFKFYTQNYFNNAMTWSDINELVKTIIKSANNFFETIIQAYGDLDEKRINELVL